MSTDIIREVAKNCKKKAPLKCFNVSLSFKEINEMNAMKLKELNMETNF